MSRREIDNTVGSSSRVQMQVGNSADVGWKTEIPGDVKPLSFPLCYHCRF